MRTATFLSASLIFPLALLASGCGDDDPTVNPDPTEMDSPNPDGMDSPNPTGEGQLHVLASVGTGEAAATYLAPVESFEDGTLTFVGQGTELGGFFWPGIAHGSFVYGQDFTSMTLKQLRPTEDGAYTTEAELLLSALTAAGSYRTVQVMDDRTLLLITWPDPTGMVEYAFVDIPELTVRDRGSFTMEPVDSRYNPVEVGSPVVVGDKVYLGTMYWVEESQEFHTSFHTLVLDYPSMTNPQRFSNDGSVGATGGWATQSMFIDEEGYIYQHNIRSKFWYNMGTAEDKPALITRIRAGEVEYDASYNFDVSSQFTEKVSLIALTYVGDGIAYGAMLWEDRATDWEEAYSQNRGFVALIDLRNQIVTPMNVPDSPVLTTGVPFVEDATFYMPIAPVGGEARVMIMDPTQGADGFRQGLRLDGNGVQVQSLLRTVSN